MSSSSSESDSESSDEDARKKPNKSLTPSKVCPECMQPIRLAEDNKRSSYRYQKSYCLSQIAKYHGFDALWDWKEGKMHSRMHLFALFSVPQCIISDILVIGINLFGFLCLACLVWGFCERALVEISRDPLGRERNYVNAVHMMLIWRYSRVLIG